MRNKCMEIINLVVVILLVANMGISLSKEDYLMSLAYIALAYINALLALAA